MTSFSIVGAKFRPPALGLLSVLGTDTPLIARREPQNAYDTNAIMVVWRTTRPADMGLTVGKMDEVLAGFGSNCDEICSSPEWHLGYIPRGVAEKIAPEWDDRKIIEVSGKLTFSASGVAQITLEEKSWS